MTRRRRVPRWVLTLAMVATVGVAMARPAAAQSTIFNVPTTDTEPPHKLYVEFDYLPQMPAPDQGGRFQIFVPRALFGVTPQVEVGVNVVNTHYSGSETFSSFQPNIKYKFFADDNHGLAASAGIVGYMPLNHRDGADGFGLVYANISKKMTSGTRVTAGPYGTVAAADNVGGITLGLEQAITGTVSVVADWFSGKNAFGYFTAGISVALPHSGLFNIGYSLGNDSYQKPRNNNRALFIYYGAVLR